MRKQSGAIDGFVPRRTGRTIGNGSQTSIGSSRNSLSLPRVDQSAAQRRQPIQNSSSVPQRSVSRQEIDDSLKDIHDDGGRAAKKRGIFAKKPKPPKSGRRRWIKRLIIFIILVGVLAGGYVGVKGLLATTNILKGNIFDVFQNKPLKEDANGRTNVLIFGTSGSVDDEDHPGANLTDTLMVLSIDQDKKNAFMISLPRDLYVNYGETCMEGYRGKINSLYECYSGGESDDASDAKGARALQDKVGEITGLDLQYYAHINWAVVVGAIDAIGGVNVDVQGDGSCGNSKYAVVDYNMKIKYTAGVHAMSGVEALTFSRARGAAGGCGLGRGDFDRQINQQKVLKAMREKAASAETLTNIGKVTGLIDALGQNLRTSFETSEIRTLMSLGNDIPSDKIQTIDLKNPEDELIVGDMLDGASIQVPRAGTYDYSEIKSYLKKNLNANEITREAANLAVFNGSGVPGYAQKRADALTDRGFTISAIDNAPDGSYKKVEIYDLTKSKPATKKTLEGYYNVKAKTTDPPIEVTSDTDFIIIYGEADSAN